MKFTTLFEIFTFPTKFLLQPLPIKYIIVSVFCDKNGYSKKNISYQIVLKLLNLKINYKKIYRDENVIIIGTQKKKHLFYLKNSGRNVSLPIF